jgi:hypothetical protein
LEKYQSQEVATNKLEKGPLIDFKTVSCSPVALTVLGRRYLKIELVFMFLHFLLGKYSEFRNHVNKF